MGCNPEPHNVTNPDGYQLVQINHPSSGPSDVNEPNEIPPAFQGNGVPYMYHGRAVSFEELCRGRRFSP